ncbi:uncharacterized protein LOC135142940 isoform X2 [Zophobas morio]|jgi:hypothetical protein|uniref:uncharacterized protein LOC135142940 isoform X2 n=1 Tax=Zophobas morio TaxID=2755281 RepID=UPI0030832CFD
MADYWVSTPKHYCKFCKCWMNDHKTVIMLHERGPKHQAAVARRIREAREKSSEASAESAELLKKIDQLSRDAMTAYEKDLSENSYLLNDSSFLRELERNKRTNQIMSKSQEFQGAAAAEAALIEVQKKAQDRQKKEFLDFGPAVNKGTICNTAIDEATGLGLWHSVGSSSEEEKNSSNNRVVSSVPFKELPKLATEAQGDSTQALETTYCVEEKECEINKKLSKRMKKLKEEEEEAKAIFVSKVTPVFCSASRLSSSTEISFRKRPKRNARARDA